MGFAGGLDASGTLAALTGGFGETLGKIGIVIACGTVIGTFLERSGAARTMAETVLRAVGERRSPLAMNVVGYIVSIPVFCDSGFVILAALLKALGRRTGVSMSVLAVALSTGLYATRVFVPPTPGPLAGADRLGADLGTVIVLGMVAAVPAALVGLAWALWYGARFMVPPGPAPEEPDEAHRPAAIASFLPVFIPIILIALRSFVGQSTPASGAASGGGAPPASRTFPRKPNPRQHIRNPSS